MREKSFGSSRVRWWEEEDSLRVRGTELSHVLLFRRKMSEDSQKSDKDSVKPEVKTEPPGVVRKPAT